MKTLLCLLLCCCQLSAFAKEGTVEQINKIKMNRAYLYGESRNASQSEATTLAYNSLQEEIRQWAIGQSQKQADRIIATDINSLVDTLVVKQEFVYRVFVYVKKSNLIPVSKKSKIVNIESKEIDEKDKKEDVKEEKDSLKEKEQVEDMSSKTASVKDSLLLTVEQTDSILSVMKKTRVNRALEMIKSAKNFFDLKNIIPPMQKEGLITQYLKYAQVANADDYYLLIYDPAGNIKALLDKGKEIRLNLKTGQSDNIHHYRGCGAICFQLSE